MPDGRHRDGSGLHFAVGCYQLLDRPEGAASKFLGHAVRPGYIRIYHSDQAHNLALLRQLVIDAGVIASEGSDAYNCNVNEVIVQFRFSGSILATLRSKL